MNSSPATFLIRPVRPDEYAALGELTVAAYHALTDVHFGPEARARQLQYDAELHDVAKRAELSRYARPFSVRTTASPSATAASSGPAACWC